MPPASFDFLVLSLATQAQMALGLFPMDDGKTERNLAIARHFIDLLGVLQEKTKNNLTIEEQRLLENSITELRFRFVQASEEEQKNASTPAQEAGANG